MASARSLLILALVALLGSAHGKVFERCELVRELRRLGSNMPSTWTCLAFYESSYNTAAIGGPNSNGTYDHGIFQINDGYWCNAGSGIGGDCNVNCATLRTDDITAAFTCASFIQQRQGFSAWSTWSRCNNAENESSWTAGC